MCLEHSLRMTLKMFHFFPSETMILWIFLPFEVAMQKILKLCEDIRERGSRALSPCLALRSQTAACMASGEIMD